jgi:hypothetical protein
MIIPRTQGDREPKLDTGISSDFLPAGLWLNNQGSRSKTEATVLLIIALAIAQHSNRRKWISIRCHVLSAAFPGITVAIDFKHSLPRE